MSSNWTTSGPELHLPLTPRGSRRSALESALRAAIRDGRLAPGARLPSTRTLAGDLGVSRGTVVEAFAQLSAEGYLDARHGGGTWVAGLSLPAARHGAPPTPAVQPLRWDFHPGLPNLTAFPRTPWMRAVRQAIATLPAAALGYGDPRGRADLRAELAAYLARARGLQVADPGLVVVCGGFQHGLSLVARALRAQGVRRIALEDPCLPAHREVASATGLRPQQLPVDGRGARTDMLAGSGAEAAVLAPARQFPTGVVLHPERRSAAVGWATSTGATIVEDDYDGELRYDRHPVGALQALAPAHVVYGGTASKTLAPGLRIGWLVVPPALVDPIVRVRLAEDVHTPVLEQAAFHELLRSGVYERHIRRARARYRIRRDRLLEVLAARVPVLEPVGISAGLSVLLELPDGGPSSAELARRAAERSIGLYPLPPYHAGDTAPRDGLVIGYGALPEHEFEAGLRALADLLAQTIPS